MNMNSLDEKLSILEDKIKELDTLISAKFSHFQSISSDAQEYARKLQKAEERIDTIISQVEELRRAG